MINLEYVQQDFFENFVYYNEPSKFGTCHHCWIDFERYDTVVEWQGRKIHEECQTQLMKEYDPLSYARAVLCLANTSNDERFKFVAFMNVMHPTMTQDEIRQMANEIYGCR